ncbi:succinate dehydrogenase, cytochrome b556 subunit [Croceicoccus sp. F390]|uniref:Succinate dehydrogenase cytochrome b556 subunit n=1 Tax=Croceicoccus esteveae TaxID=3075597 RepID=A0ABU2ZE37_9SPHN|nr:succinate dehydrogenase, cytochrome b556 subunit [Croceicoccus sp. F390]MDT0574871.1 succinate dehydrogenase, cytochrome b556 subunit [Croceicoccus sp. F390]
MADARGGNRYARPRPLSPHLSIWKWGPAMLSSILHRVTGNAMATLGLLILLWMLGAIAAGPQAYAVFAAVMGNPVGIIVLIGISWSFFNHMCSGIRHLVMDVGAGFEVERNNRAAIISIVCGVVLTVAFWLVILLK